MKNRIDDFEQNMKSTLNNILKNIIPSTNITRHQKYLLDILQTHPDLMVIDTDKILGPAVIKRDRYIYLILQEHLTKGHIYKNITQVKAHYMTKTLEHEIK